MKRILYVAAVLVAVAFTSCDNSGQDDGADRKEEKISSRAKVGNPCELLTEQDIRSHFDVGSDEEFEMRQEDRTYPTCFFKWGTNVYQGVVQAGGKTITYDAPGEVSVVVASGAGKYGFEKSLVAYKDAQDMPRIGTRAVWGNQLSQLTFYNDHALVHIHVKVSADHEVNKQHAVQLSEMVMKRMNFY